MRASSDRWGRLGARLGLLPRSVRRVQHRVDSVLGNAGRLRLAFGSDFHAGPFTPWSLLEHSAEALAEARPDVLMLGGDYVFHEIEPVERLCRILAEVPAPVGRYAVLGNHDVLAGARRIRRTLERAGFEVLVNRSVRLPEPFEDVSVCGIDDPWLGRPDAQATFEDAGPRRIFLTHSPSGLALLDGRRFDLALAGHTHGGQLAFPNGRPLIVPHGPLCDRYHFGRFRVDDGTLLVSRGVGAVLLPMRIFAPPDIIVCDLE